MRKSRSAQDKMPFNPTIAETDHLMDKIAQKQEQHLIPLKEDLADWLNKTLGRGDITADNFMDRLDNGVIVCKLARLIQQKAEECHHQGVSPKPIQNLKFKCWENAKPSSFYARDNTENFLKWCRKFGVNEAVVFESDGLVLHTQARTVVLCLLELGRIASKFRLDPPGLIKLEKEIEEEEADQLGSLSPVPTLSPISTSPDSSSPNSRSATPTRSYRPSELDKKVRKIADTTGTEKDVTRISEGRYNIAGRIVFVRLLKDRHVMVRVGGGWDTLEHFLSRHEPCGVILVNRGTDEYSPITLTSLPRLKRSDSQDSFLHIRAKYKSQSPRWKV